MNCTIQDVLKFMALMRQPKRCTEGFVLEHGVEFKITNAPAGFKHRKMKECYRNATQLTFDNPSRYTYCEGFVLFFGPTMHAWVYDNETGEAFDPTWKTPGEGYFGIPFSTAYVRDATLRSGYYGLLDNAPLDWELERGLVSANVFRRELKIIGQTVNSFTPLD